MLAPKIISLDGSEFGGQGKPGFQQVPENVRSKLAKIVTTLFSRWNLTNEEQLNLLGLGRTSRGVLVKYRAGSPLPDRRDLLDRVALLLTIHRYLRDLYPRNEEICYGWMKMRNESFDSDTPLKTVMLEGVFGLHRIVWHLNQRVSR